MTALDIKMSFMWSVLGVGQDLLSPPWAPDQHMSSSMNCPLQLPMNMTKEVRGTVIQSSQAHTLQAVATSAAPLGSPAFFSCGRI